MTDSYGPFDSSPWADQTQWYRHGPKWAASGVNGSPVSSSTSGDLALSWSGLTPTIAAGRAWVRGAGFERSAAAALSAVAANTNGSLSRRDRIVLRRDLTAKTVALTAIAGTPSSSPTAPAVQRNDTGQWDLPLFSFLVPPNSGTTISGIIDERAWLDPNASAPVSVWNSNGLAALSAFGDASPGAIAYTAVDGRRNQWESTVWHRLPTAGLVFSTLAARDSWFGANNPPVAGDSCVCKGTQMTHDGTAWRFTLSGTYTVVSDVNGFGSIPHGGGQVPVGWVITPGYQSPASNDAVIKILSSSNVGDINLLGFRVVRTDTGAYWNVTVTVTWMAKF